MATLFSSDGAGTVQRALPLGPGARAPPAALAEFYELERAAAFVTASGFRRVALQFPDELLADSAAVAAKMEEATGSKMYILGDTSYGSCCVDEVAAEHVEAEAVVHYGPACLSPCRKLPVLHVFGRQPLDTERCAGAFRELYPDPQSHVVVLSDVVYAHALELPAGLPGLLPARGDALRAGAGLQPGPRVEQPLRHRLQGPAARWLRPRRLPSRGPRGRGRSRRLADHGGAASGRSLQRPRPGRQLRPGLQEPRARPGRDQPGGVLPGVSQLAGLGAAAGPDAGGQGRAGSQGRCHRLRGRGLWVTLALGGLP